MSGQQLTGLNAYCYTQSAQATRLIVLVFTISKR